MASLSNNASNVNVLNSNAQAAKTYSIANNTELSSATIQSAKVENIDLSELFNTGSNTLEGNSFTSSNTVKQSSSLNQNDLSHSEQSIESKSNVDLKDENQLSSALETQKNTQQSNPQSDVKEGLNSNLGSSMNNIGGSSPTAEKMGGLNSTGMASNGSSSSMNQTSSIDGTKMSGDNSSGLTSGGSSNSSNDSDSGNSSDDFVVINSGKGIVEKYNALPASTLRTTYLQFDELFEDHSEELSNLKDYMYKNEMVVYLYLCEEVPEDAPKYLSEMKNIVIQRKAMESAINYIKELDKDSTKVEEMITKELKEINITEKNIVDQINNILNNTATEKDLQSIYKLSLLSTNNEYSKNIPIEYKTNIYNFINNVINFSNYYIQYNNNVKIANKSLQSIDTHLNEVVKLIDFYKYKNK